MAQSLDTEGAGKAGSGDVVLSNWTNAGRKDESATAKAIKTANGCIIRIYVGDNDNLGQQCDTYTETW